MTAPEVVKALAERNPRASVVFNRVASEFDVVKAGVTIASYKNYTMALCRMNYENGV